MRINYQNIIIKCILLTFNYNIIYGLLPTNPNNIVCFIERDFCTVENYKEYTNTLLTLNVIRNNQIFGSVKGTVSGGDIAFEVNHPGALCWGENTNIQVTPDIKSGDIIELKNNNLLISDIQIQNGYVSDKVKNGNTVTITGFIDSTIDKNNMEVGIVNPEFKTTTIARRDARALFGPVIGTNAGYSSGISVSPDNIFTATFIFTESISAAFADAGSVSLTMWQDVDNLGNPLGITISELGEIGGPYSAICPPYASMITANINNFIVFNNFIRWDKNINALPGSSAITQFNIEIIKKINDNVNAITGYRLLNTIDKYEFNNIQLTDKIEFRTITDSKLSDPIIIQLNDLQESANLLSIPASDGINYWNTNLVELRSNTQQIIYTIDETEPTFDNGIIYLNPITISKEMTIKAIGVAYNGKKSQIMTYKYKPLIQEKILLPPNGVTVTSISNGLSVKWKNINDPLINLFKINVYSNNILIKSIETTFNSIIINGLIPDVMYSFTTSAKYENTWSAESEKSIPITFPKLVDNIMITSSKWKSTDFRILGFSSMPNVLITAYYSNLDNTISNNPIKIVGTNSDISGRTGLAADITNNFPFTIRITKNQVPANPVKFFIKSSGGGVYGPYIL